MFHLTRLKCVRDCEKQSSLLFLSILEVVAPVRAAVRWARSAGNQWKSIRVREFCTQGGSTSKNNGCKMVQDLLTSAHVRHTLVAPWRISLVLKEHRPPMFMAQRKSENVDIYIIICIIYIYIYTHMSTIFSRQEGDLTDSHDLTFHLLQKQGLHCQTT